MPRWLDRTPLAVALVTLTIASTVGDAAAVPVRVRGESSLRLVAFEQGAETVLRGEVADDVGASMAGAKVEIELGEAPRRATSCAEGAGGRAEIRGALVVATADDRGTFCVRVTSGPRKGAVLRARIAATELFEGASAAATVEGDASGLVKTTLRFESPPADVDLDRPSVRLTATLGVDREGAERLALTAVRREGLTLLIEDERGTELARATTGGDGRARFEVATAALDGPGHGELRVRFAGTTALHASTASIPVDRSARVALALASAPDPGVADDGVALEVAVTTSRGPVDGGVVEARIGNLAVGAATVAKGRASVLVAVPGRRPGQVPVSLRFVPAAPWYVPGPELATSIEIRPPSPLGLIALFALVAAVGVWVVQRWRRPPKPAQDESSAAPPKPPGHAEVLVVASSRGDRGWRGRVIDAHDGAGIEGAEVVVTRPTFEGDGVLARVVTDARGAFELSIDGPPPEGATLRSEGAVHASIEQALPVPGELRIALVTRRRALLDRLVRWARAKGSPWDGQREPTPGHVRRVASRSESAEIASWAGSVEAAAFGAAPVDRAAEGEVRSREPGATAR